MPKVKVECQQLNLNEKTYMRGDVVEVTAEEAKELVKDKNASAAPDNAKAATGVVRDVDPVERDIREKNYEAARASGVIQAPADAGGLPTPQVGPAAAMKGAERLPHGAKIEPMPGSSSKG